MQIQTTDEQNIPGGQQPTSREALARQIAALGEWFHNLDLNGIPTAPHHFLGDYPMVKWRRMAAALPQDLSGATVLDVGCNAGFYSLEMKRRGAARVLGIDVEDRYLNQARFAAATLGLPIEVEKRSVYDVDAIAGQFDYVLFMGLIYHLRYPLLALDKVVKKVGGQLLFQTMLRGSQRERRWPQDLEFWAPEPFADPDFPQAYFIEHKFAGDQTNWWIPNRGAAEGMLRSAGLEIVQHPEPETWLCVPRHATRDGRYILEMELDGTL